MYVPKSFAETRSESLRQLISNCPLATLVTMSSGKLNANHLPLFFTDTPKPFGSLQGHVAKTNPLWQELRSDTESLAIFTGPDAYISPSLYATKHETGKVVPTWNYIVVHAYGVLQCIEDEAWIRKHLENLTARQEATLAEPWKLTDAPVDFINTMLGSVVGIELVITEVIGKWKISQNQPRVNKESAAYGLRNYNSPVASAMAGLIESSKDRDSESE